VRLECGVSSHLPVIVILILDFMHGLEAGLDPFVWAETGLPTRNQREAFACLLKYSSIEPGDALYTVITTEKDALNRITRVGQDATKAQEIIEGFEDPDRVCAFYLTRKLCKPDDVVDVAEQIRDMPQEEFEEHHEELHREVEKRRQALLNAVEEEVESLDPDRERLYAALIDPQRKRYSHEYTPPEALAIVENLSDEEVAEVMPRLRRVRRGLEL